MKKLLLASVFIGTASSLAGSELLPYQANIPQDLLDKWRRDLGLLEEQTKLSKPSSAKPRLPDGSEYPRVEERNDVSDFGLLIVDEGSPKSGWLSSLFKRT